MVILPYIVYYNNIIYIINVYYIYLNTRLCGQ